MNYYLLGQSGLRVSPLCLGTMTFGTEWGFGVEKNVSRKIFDRYLEWGGNFIDTADGYTNGRSEEWVGEFIRESGTRDKMVLATKFAFGAQPGNPNAGGNGRKNILRALEGSLKRLNTDYIDLYWLHAWDMVTPVEEVMSTLNDLVRAGKILHIGLSDVPAWYAARAQTIAVERGWEKVCALQLEYSLVARALDREHAPMAKELGMAICPWSPLAGGFLSGKYQRQGNEVKGSGRVQLTQNSGNPVMDRFFKQEKNWKILETLMAVSREVGKTPAEVALNWVSQRANVVSPIVGATKIEQLESNLRALEFTIPAPLRARLDQVSQLEPNEIDLFWGPTLQGLIHCGVPVTRHPDL